MESSALQMNTQLAKDEVECFSSSSRSKTYSKNENEIINLKNIKRSQNSDSADCPLLGERESLSHAENNLSSEYSDNCFLACIGKVFCCNF